MKTAMSSIANYNYRGQRDIINGYFTYKVGALMNNLLMQAINSIFSYVGYIFVTENTLSEEAIEARHF